MEWRMGNNARCFSARGVGIAPVSDGGISWRTSKLLITSVLAVHGAEDDAVLYIYSRLMVDDVNNSGENAGIIE